MIDVRPFAEQLAARVGGRVVELEATDLESTLAIAIPDGRMPALVRGYARAWGVVVRGVYAHLGPPKGSRSKVLDTAVRAIEAFVASNPVDQVSLVELALRIREYLGTAVGERFAIAFPGVADPSEAWLHPADHDAASVGVFDGRVVVWVDSEARTTLVERRGSIEAAAREVAQNVAVQRDRYREHVASSAVVTELARTLVERLGDALGRSFGSHTEFRPSHAGAVRERVVDRATNRVVLEVRALRSDAFVDRVPGGPGTRIPADAIDAEFERLVDGIRRGLAGLSLDALARGRPYRVLESIGGLVAGSEVEFVRFDDIDNHYGAYVFRAGDGAEVAVLGDFSQPHRHAFYETARYLEPRG